MSDIDDKYEKLGGKNGFLGRPIHEEKTCPDGVGRFRMYKSSSPGLFMFSSIHWHPSTGAFETHGAIRHTWGRLGSENCFLGYPVSDEKDYSSDDFIREIYGSTQFEKRPENHTMGRISYFQGGAIIWWASNSAYSRHGQEYTILLRPNSIGPNALWFPVCDYGLWLRLLHAFVGGSSGIEISTVHIDNIGSDYGSKLWQDQCLKHK